MVLEGLSYEDITEILAAIPSIAAVALPDPLPAVARADIDIACVLLAVTTPSRKGHISYGLVAFESGELDWIPLASITAKYPPDGSHRLRLGWARKGPNGDGRG